MRGLKLEQIKMDAIIAKKLHNKKIKKINACKNIFTVISIILPTLITVLMYFSKGTSFQFLIDGFSFISSIGLIIYSIILLVLNIDGKLHQHKLYVSKNIDIITESDNLILQENINQEVINWFSKYASEMDKNDNDLLNPIKEEDKRDAYREALKECNPGNSEIVCPNCKKSPWKYIKGDCQLCGNKIGE